MVAEGRCRPLGFVVIEGQGGDITHAQAALEAVSVPTPHGRRRTRPEILLGDKAYSSRAFRRTGTVRSTGLRPSGSTSARTTSSRTSTNGWAGSSPRTASPDTLKALTDASAGDDDHAILTDAARKELAAADRKLGQYRALLEAGTDPKTGAPVVPVGVSGGGVSGLVVRGGVRRG